MLRRTRSVLLAVGLIAPAVVLGGHTPASAIDQDLVVSATSGAPGTVVTVSSASCTFDFDAEPDFENLRFLEVRLISGAAPDEVLVAIGRNVDGSESTFEVPDWVDPSQPAVIEAVCRSFNWNETNDEGSVEAYDTVPFDIEPGAGPVTQTRTISRTELLAGQALSVSASGCSGREFGGVAVFPGDDLSGRTFVQPVVESNADIVDGAFEVELAFTTANADWSFQFTNDDPLDDRIEIPNTLAPGPYALVPYCGGEEGTWLFYEPTVIDVTGSAPTGDIDLTSPVDSRSITLAGGSCTETVTAGFWTNEFGSDNGYDIGDEYDSRSRLDAGGDGSSSSPFDREAAGPPPSSASRGSSSTTPGRLLDDGDYNVRDLTPDAAGFWSGDDVVSFDHGRVEADAVCGDPLGDGFVYDPQIVEVHAAVAPPTTTTPTTTPTATPPLAPPAAVAVPGVPTYAG